MARASEPPVVLAKGYDLSKWLLARIEHFPKSHRLVFGQRRADRTLGVLDTLVDATYSPAGRRRGGQPRTPGSSSTPTGQWSEPVTCGWWKARRT